MPEIFQQPLSPRQRRGYRHVYHGLSCILRTEGLGALYRGAGPTAMRAALVTMSQLATYEELKGWHLIRFSSGQSVAKDTEGNPNQFLALILLFKFHLLKYRCQNCSEIFPAHIFLRMWE